MYTFMNKDDYLKASNNQKLEEETKKTLSVIQSNQLGYIEQLREKSLTAKGKLVITHRQINHWSSFGLIDDSRETDEKMNWRKYSVLDVVWLGIILNSRQLGYPLDSLRKAKDIWYSLEEDGKIFPLIETYISMGLQNVPCTILLYPNGFLELYTLREYVTALNLGNLLSHHISISLSFILEEIFDVLPDISDVFMPIPIKQDPRVKSFSVMYDAEGNINSYEHKLNYTNKNTQIQKLLKGANFQDIKIKQQSGGITHIEQIVKQKIQKKAK